MDSYRTPKEKDNKSKAERVENAVLREKSDKVLDWGEVIDNAECGYCEGRVSDCLFCGGDYKDADDLRTTKGCSPLAGYTIEGVDRLKVENTELRKKAQLLDGIEEQFTIPTIALEGEDELSTQLSFCYTHQVYVIEDIDGVVLETDSFKEGLEFFIARMKEDAENE